MTGLPADKTPWPPTRDISRYSKMRVASIWYEGNPENLANLYRGGVVETVPAGNQGGFLTSTYRLVHKWFWGSPPVAGEKDNKIHVPIAADIATLSSELLFAEPPTVKLDAPKKVQPKAPPKPSPVTGTLPPDPLTGVVPDATEPPADPITGEPETEEVDDPAAIEAQETLEWLLDRIGFQALCLAAAETQSPLGSVCLRVAWDKSVDAKAPFLTRVDADSAVPEYRWGKLVALTFWTVIESHGQTVVRFLERYEPGFIYYGVYAGTADNIGIRVPYTDYAETAWVADIPNLVGDEVAVPEGVLMATSVPNALPDAADRNSVIGRSDLTPGVITLMDAVDEIATSLMRDIHLGKGRVFLARYMLDDNGPGKGASFNEDQAYFSPLRMNPSEKDEAPIVATQFQIRVDEHLKAIEWYASKAVRAAGYNPDSDFGDNGGDMTATEYSGRNRRSFSTRAKKVLYWTQALEGILEAMVKVFNAEFANAAASGKKPIPEEWPIRVEFPPAAHPDLKYLAETANLMKQAQAASTRVRVQLLHPEWTDLEIDEEVLAIEDEGTAVDPATFGLAPGGVGGDNPPEVNTPSPFESDPNAGQPNA